MIYVLVALENELPDELPDDYRLVYTGIGKINATYAALKTALLEDCEEIINYGTAGTLNHAHAGELLQIGTLHQRDMDARPLAALGETPLETRVSAQAIELPSGAYSLSTGDNFVTATPEIASDAVDMEAYAIAKVCALEGVPFSCFKFITDLADENAAEHWQENVSLGAKAFTERLFQASSGGC
ncbi:MAG: hypothetical protein ACPGSC_09195 [Granulosicoccaceae bacterium]